MSEELPLVTIGIPTYNRSKYLKEALESALNQTYPNIEIIVSDNASTDDTQEMMKQYISNPKVKYFRQKENIGVPGNWNTCLNIARGKYFLLLSDDDILEKEAIEVLVSKFQDNRVVMAYCNHVIIDGNSIIREDHPNGVWNPKSLESGNNFIIRRFKFETGCYPSSELFITDILKKYGGYPLSALGAADMAAELVFGSEGYVSYDSRKLCKYRVHENNAVKNNISMFKGMMGLYEFVQKTDKLKRYVKEMRLYNASTFYKYIRHEFIRGRINKPDILELIEYLKILKYKYRRLSLYKLKLIQKLAKFRRKIMEIKDD
ncbi:MAG: glycosyltransferase family 2 protein [Caldisphaera sp.]